MYVESRDRTLIRRALRVMSGMATDELMDEDVESMYAPNIQFIASALEGVTNKSHRDVVSDDFNEMELAQLENLRNQFLAVLTVSGTPRSIISDNVELSDREVEKLLTEGGELERKRYAISLRLEAIHTRIVDSGESKLRRSRSVDS